MQLLLSFSSSSSSTFLTLALLHTILIVHGQHLIPNRSRVPAFLAFGDSLLDPGNNNVLQTVLKSDFPPYGKDFEGHEPTGRFSNGKIATDFIGTLLTLLLHHALLVVSLNQNRTRVPALLAFGDSLHDPGNNNLLPTFLRSDFPPYGIDFVGHRATGRFSNGKISPDVLASYLGLKELLPAYLDPELKPEDLLTGVSFASAGTGYDILTAETLSVLSMRDQLDLFRDYIEKLKQVAGVERAHRIISDSLYVVSGGSNDILVTFFDTTLRTWHSDVSSYVDLLIHSASNVVKELYSLGARKIGVVGLTPLGCLPFQRSFKGGIQRSCAAPANEAAIKFNSKLIKAAKTFSSKLKGSRIGYLNLYDPVHAVIQNPSNYGFEESSKGCCGTGKIEISFLCNDINPHTCSNASTYAFWDSFHPSERLIEIVLAQVIKNDFPGLL